MERPFAWFAAAAGIIAALCALLPWHTIELSHPLSRLGGGDLARATHSGTECGLHGIWLLVLGAVAAAGAIFIALGNAHRLPCTPCKVMLLVAILLATGALLVAWDLFRDSAHCFDVHADQVLKDERENGFYIALIASILGALSAALGCVARRVPEDPEP